MRIRDLVLNLVLSVSLAILLAGSIGAQKQPSAKKNSKKRICLTFNELPVALSFSESDREALTYLILEALKAHDIKAAGFVVGNQIEDGWAVLGEWLNNGHVLGSMTYSNQDFNDLSIGQSIKEIRRGADFLEQMLKGFGQKKRYFRYPYLHYGMTVKAREQTTGYCEENNIIVTHATVVPEDYLFNLSLDKLGKRPDSASWEQLRNEYLNHVFDELERCERLAKEIVGRPVRQILLLRANRLNAVFLEDLITALIDEGYTFVSLDNAMKDHLYSMSEAYYGMKGLGYLDMMAESDPDLLPAE